MTTARNVLNPKKLKHKWTLNMETGLPEIEGLSNDDLVQGFRSASATPCTSSSAVDCVEFC